MTAIRKQTQKRPRGKSIGQSLRLQLIKRLLENELEPGYHLATQSLAEQYKVSRQPVKEVLQALAEEGILEHKKHRGYFLAISSAELAERRLVPHDASAEQPYLRIAEDRLLGRLPGEVTEAELMRHYQITRHELQDILMRMAREGWIEPKPGYGWRFLPVLTSPDSLEMCYRFRLTIEPAALLEPSYLVNSQAFSELRHKQQQLLDGGVGNCRPTICLISVQNFMKLVAAIIPFSSMPCKGATAYAA